MSPAKPRRTRSTTADAVAAVMAVPARTEAERLARDWLIRLLTEGKTGADAAAKK